MASSYVIDMDGVIYRGNRLIPGAREFIQRLVRGKHRFLFLTNNSSLTPGELRRKLGSMGIDVEECCFFTSALATADFLDGQQPRGKAYVIGGDGLEEALMKVGYTLTDDQPDYVVIGTTRSYSYDRLVKAVEMVRAGARLIGTNPDVTSPSDRGVTPGCGALVAPIRLATGAHPYFVGKPNPLMMRTALRRLRSHSADAFMVGDRMDTDIVAGTEAGMRTILVLSGVTSPREISHYAFRPHHVFDTVGDIPVSQLG